MNNPEISNSMLHFTISGNHLKPEWKKWTAEEAQQMFERFEFTGDVGKIPVSDTRF